MSLSDVLWHWSSTKLSKLKDHVFHENQSLATMTSAQSIDTINDYINGTFATRSDLDLFLNCFREQTCDTCLASRYTCSWCATSQVCVPNEHFRAPFAILAPIKYEDICPLAWRERWEMRAKPFSCRCSTMTLMSVVVAIVSTLAAVFLIHLIVIATRWGCRRWKTRRQGWWRSSAYDWKPSKPTLPRWMVRRPTASETAHDSERQALLASTGSSRA